MSRASTPARLRHPRRLPSSPAAKHARSPRKAPAVAMMSRSGHAGGNPAAKGGRWIGPRSKPASAPRSSGSACCARARRPSFERLTGGVSSDIWRVDLARGPVCVKRALAKLRVAQDWFAPVERNAYEAAWMRRAAAVRPRPCPSCWAGCRGGRVGHGLSRSGAPRLVEGGTARRPRRAGDGGGGRRAPGADSCRHSRRSHGRGRVCDRPDFL